MALFSPNIPSQVQEKVSNLIDTKEVVRHNKYLGLPILIKTNKNKNFKF